MADLTAAGRTEVGYQGGADQAAQALEDGKKIDPIGRGDVEGLAAAIESILTNPDLAHRLGKAARRQAEAGADDAHVLPREDLASRQVMGDVERAAEGERRPFRLRGPARG